MKIKRYEFIEKWLEALESGGYKQAPGFLRTEALGKPRYCCLGVACELANKLSTKVDYFEISDQKILPNTLARFMGIDSVGGLKEFIIHGHKEYGSLAELNDSGVKFKTIARIIREQLANKNFEKP